MVIEHYAFALFIAGLVCLVVILAKVLFSDLKRQHKLLDEKESKLLQLYSTVENIMEEFAEQAKVTADEIKEFESRVAMRAASITLPLEAVKDEQVIEKLPAARPVTVDSTRIRAASEVLERAERIVKSDTVKPPVKNTQPTGAVFQSFFDETAETAPPLPEAANNKKSRNEMIMELASQGKSDPQIASELGITQNEVRLILDLSGVRN